MTAAFALSNAPVAIVAPAEPRVEVRSLILGVLRAHPDHLFTFPAGLAGLPEQKEWVLVQAGRHGYWWLQSRNEPGLAFLLADPFPAFPGYEVSLGAGDLAMLGSSAREDVVVLAIVTLPGRPGAPCVANLQGPVALDLRTRTGKQVVIADSPFGTRCEMPTG
jgi:flagellar assembly factor FliW